MRVGELIDLGYAKKKKDTLNSPEKHSLPFTLAMTMTKIITKTMREPTTIPMIPPAPKSRPGKVIKYGLGIFFCFVFLYVSFLMGSVIL